MNTFQLTCFLAVAETLNFARAAERLHVTQPALSRQRMQLGVKLLRRPKVRALQIGLQLLPTVCGQNCLFTFYPYLCILRVRSHGKRRRSP